MARQLIQAGARLAICARDPQELERSRLELEQRGGEVLAIPCDATDKTQVEQMIQQVRDRFGAIDILINNAGTDFVGPMDVMTLEYIKLIKNNAPDGQHHWFPIDWVRAVDERAVYLKKTVDEVIQELLNEQPVGV
ncbi:MAG: SDR family NAD(P)-dependent oxidoreductase [Nostoc sp. CmiVER01]|uniref:SDR family NAD(P)-dependent oxidoreductase n=1 Tax=Nostoc sp. CmiVER01 TaxID=3075384 RepID=UPI002AD4EBB2|nr:SDR family NAD(P)-dependent oxidoreductase [Nostoc sp. CmiVER01]MDZ8126911.1 SDR family NAD(P)-dependent oxidoreductase [Nostoc sp. CmiVER01]